MLAKHKTTQRGFMLANLHLLNNTTKGKLMEGNGISFTRIQLHSGSFLERRREGTLRTRLRQLEVEVF